MVLAGDLGPQDHLAVEAASCRFKRGWKPRSARVSEPAAFVPPTKTATTGGGFINKKTQDQPL